MFFVLLYIPDRYVLHSMISDFELQRKLLEKFNLKNRRRKSKIFARVEL